MASPSGPGPSQKSRITQQTPVNPPQPVVTGTAGEHVSTDGGNKPGGLIRRSRSVSGSQSPQNKQVPAAPPVVKGPTPPNNIQIHRGRKGNEMLTSQMPSHFDADEIKRLGKRFRKLDLDNSGYLSVDEFMTLPELQQNPLVQRVVDIFDGDGNGGVDFKEFMQGVSQFSVKGDKESKLRFAFRIYDMDNDGYISNGELFQVLKMMVGSNLKDTQLQQIVDKTIVLADKDEDGKISFQEFCSVVGNTDIHKKMVVDV